MPDIRTQIAILEARQEVANARLQEVQREIRTLEDEIRAVIAACPKTSGKKYAGGGGGIPGASGYWIECDVCGKRHRLTRSVFDTYPGPTTWVGDGN